MNCNEHRGHVHEHGPDCGHPAIEHGDHTDFLQNGHLLHPHGDHYDEHRLPVDGANPDWCTSGHTCEGHDPAHVHGPGCGHEPVPHGDHIDYLVDGHLHHPHEEHCDDHGPVTIVEMPPNKA